MAKTITVKTQDETTMVYYIDRQRGAVVAEVKKCWADWGVYFKGKRMEGFNLKGDAVKQARKWLREDIKLNS